MFINKRKDGKFDLIVSLSHNPLIDTNIQPDIVFMSADLDELIIIVKTSILCEESGFNSINFDLEETTFYSNVWTAEHKLNPKDSWNEIEATGEISCLPENIIKFNASIKDENDKPVLLFGTMEYDELRATILSISRQLLED